MAVRKGKRSRVKFKWTKEFGFLIAIIAVLIGAAIWLVQPSSKENMTNDLNAAMGSSDTALESDHVYQYISYDDLVGKINSNSSDAFFVLYGSTKDSTTMSSLSGINSIAKSFEINTIYILDATFYIEQEDKTDKDFKSSLDSKEVALKEVDLEVYPSLWAYKGGQLVATSDTYRDEETKSLNYDLTFVINKVLSYDADVRMNK